MNPDAPKTYDCVVIGAGQAGLSCGYYLKKNALDFLILDKVTEIGSSWKNRYDSLTLFTPNKYCQLPGAGLPGNGDPDKKSTKDEIAEYLKKYAKEQKLPILLNQEVLEVTYQNGLYTVLSSGKKYETKSVILATGPFHDPFIPEIRGRAQTPNTFQIHSSGYKNPSQIKGKKVLVVGGGNSGAQIAEELANVRNIQSARNAQNVLELKVSFSVKGHLSFISDKVLGKNVFWWLEKLHLLYAPKNSLRSRFLMGKSEPIIGTDLKKLIRQGRVKVIPEITTLKDGEFDTIIWATGYRQSYPFLKVDKDQTGLYFIGQIWQRTRSSALVGGVGRDARELISELVLYLRR